MKFILVFYLILSSIQNYAQDEIAVVNADSLYHHPRYKAAIDQLNVITDAFELSVDKLEKSIDSLYAKTIYRGCFTDFDEVQSDSLDIALNATFDCITKKGELLFQQYEKVTNQLTSKLDSIKEQDFAAFCQENEFKFLYIGDPPDEVNYYVDVTPKFMAWLDKKMHR